MEPARIAIVGTGSIARIHLDALHQLGGLAEVTGCTDIDAARLAEFWSWTSWRAPRAGAGTPAAGAAARGS